MALIEHGKVVSNDAWTHLADDEALPGQGDVTVTLARFEKERAILEPQLGRLGVRLGPEDEPAALGDAVKSLRLIAIAFPKFTDGRGYSIARLLRDRYGFGGQLRAVGNVLPDQMFYMRRCGFDAFELTEGKPVEDALKALEGFSVTYQAAADDSRPLFRRPEGRGAR